MGEDEESKAEEGESVERGGEENAWGKGSIEMNSGRGPSVEKMEVEK